MDTASTPRSLVWGGTLLSATGAAALLWLGHAPNWAGLVLGVPFGAVMYASILVGDRGETTSQRIAPFGGMVLVVLGTIVLDEVVSSSAAIGAGAALVALGVLDSVERP